MVTRVLYSQANDVSSKLPGYKNTIAQDQAARFSTCSGSPTSTSDLQTPTFRQSQSHSQSHCELLSRHQPHQPHPHQSRQPVLQHCKSLPHFSVNSNRRRSAPDFRASASSPDGFSDHAPSQHSAAKERALSQQQKQSCFDYMQKRQTVAISFAAPRTTTWSDSTWLMQDNDHHAHSSRFSSPRDSYLLRSHSHSHSHSQSGSAQENQTPNTSRRRSRLGSADDVLSVAAVDTFKSNSKKNKRPLHCRFSRSSSNLIPDSPWEYVKTRKGIDLFRSIRSRCEVRSSTLVHASLRAVMGFLCSNESNRKFVDMQRILYGNDQMLQAKFLASCAPSSKCSYFHCALKYMAIQNPFEVHKPLDLVVLDYTDIVPCTVLNDLSASYSNSNNEESERLMGFRILESIRCVPEVYAPSSHYTRATLRCEVYVVQETEDPGIVQVTFASHLDPKSKSRGNNWFEQAFARLFNLRNFMEKAIYSVQLTAISLRGDPHHGNTVVRASDSAMELRCAGQCHDQNKPEKPKSAQSETGEREGHGNHPLGTNGANQASDQSKLEEEDEEEMASPPPLRDRKECRICEKPFHFILKKRYVCRICQGESCHKCIRKMDVFADSPLALASRLGSPSVSQRQRLLPFAFGKLRADHSPQTVRVSICLCCILKTRRHSDAFQFLDGTALEQPRRSAFAHPHQSDQEEHEEDKEEVDDHPAEPADQQSEGSVDPHALEHPETWTMK